MVTTALSSSGSSVYADEQNELEQSDFSIISSLDALSISSSSRPHPHHGRSHISGSTISTGVLIVEPGSSKSAKRRARMRELKEREAATVDELLGVTNTNDDTPRKARPAVTRPLSSHGTESISPTSASSSTSGTELQTRKGRKTRRGGRKVHQRADRAQLRDALAVEDELDLLQGTPRRTVASSTVTASSSDSFVSSDCYSEDDYSEDGRDDDDGDDEDEVDALSALGSGSDAPPSSQRVLGTGSILSSEDAKLSIDDFISDSAHFTSDKANKLRLWQALCIELGLVELEETDRLDSPSSRPSRSLERSDSCGSRSPTPTPSRTPTPRPKLPPLPQTLTQASRLLKSQAHVNIVDYFDARAQGLDSYAHLNHPSKSAMIRSTRKEHKLANLDEVRSEWLEPLLKDFGFRHHRSMP